MDPTPSQTQEASADQHSSALGASWTQVGQEDTSSSTTLSPENPSMPAKKSFAEVAGREKKLLDEFPTPSEMAARTGDHHGSEGTKVDDLLKSVTQTTPQPITTPVPDRSFAAVASHKGFPLPETDATHDNQEDLSELPSVKDMLQETSVNVPPPPAAKSFAKMAAKEPPPKEPELSDRAKALLGKTYEPSPTEDNLDNFPTLAQSQAMNENGDEQNRAAYAEIARFDSMVEPNTKDENNSQEPSFADIASKNLEDAPPAPVGHVDQHPIVSEEQLIQENMRAEKRKWMQPQNEQNKEITPEQKEIQREEEQENALDQEERQENTETQTVESRLRIFDRKRSGKFTIIDTFSALRKLGYSWFSIIPITLTLHLRLSPLTSPHRLPFLYRSLTDLVTLPIYTDRVAQALTYSMPVLTQDKRHVDQLVQTYGQKRGKDNGLGFWDGFRAVHGLEKKTLRWWQGRLWTLHRFQWILTYVMLHDPHTRLVTQSTMVSLSDTCLQ